MKKLLTLLLLSPLAFAEQGNIIEANCRAFWGSSSKDIVKCINTWKNASQWGDVHVPAGAEPNLNINPEAMYLPPTDMETYDASKKPIAEICPEWSSYGDNAGYKSCSARNQTKFKRWWKPQIVGSRFKQNTNPSNWLLFEAEGVLDGWLPLTNDAELGIEMSGAWEITYATADYVQVTLYAGQSECTFSISKKGKLYWFKQSTANYSNICPSTLMIRTKIKTLSELKKELAEQNG